MTLSVLMVGPSAYPLGGVADWLDYALAGLAQSGLRCQLALVEGGGHDSTRYLQRHPWTGAMPVSNVTGSQEGRVRALMKAIRDVDAELVVSVNLVDVYEAVRRLRGRSSQRAPRVAMALHGLQANLCEDIRQHADVLDGVVATNRLSVALASAALGDAARVHYAPYGVPAAPDEASAQASKACDEPVRLLYAGRVEQDQKRVLDLPWILDALRAQGVAASLSIAGGGPLATELRAAFEQARLSDRVDWLGDLDVDALGEAYRSHDALLITSVWETGPIVAWEAMSQGLPVVSSRYVGSGLEGALIDGETAVLFETGDAQDAARAVARVRDPALRERVVAGGNALVRARYSRSSSVAAWQRALSAIATQPPKASGPVRWSPPAGRLDQWFGVRLAEHLRHFLGVRRVPESPGAAWPHSGSGSSGQAAFLERAAAIDRGQALVAV